ncbi:MAG: glutathione S-transferase family protein, partial [Hyphomicrobiales bacterium]
DDPQRGLFYSKLFFFTNDLQPALKRYFYAHRYARDKQDIAWTRQVAKDMACERWGVLGRYLLDNGPYHLGERFSLVDLHMALWAAYGFEGPDDILDAFPGVRRCYDLVAQRPKSGPLLGGLRRQVAELRSGG